MVRPDIKVGTILVNSIGSRCDTFYEVYARTEKRVRAREILYKIKKRSIRCQTMTIVPDPKRTPAPPQKGFRYDSRLKKCVDVIRNDVTLAISADGRIGPIKRLNWWSTWDEKKPLDQHSR